MLDWSKFKSVDNKLYTPRAFSYQLILMFAVITLTCFYWFAKDLDRFLVDALLHTFIALLVSSDYLIALYKYGRYGVPLLELKNETIFVRQYGYFKVKKYRLGLGDKVFVVGKPEKKNI